MEIGNTSELSLISLNNFIVLMRQPINKAKVHVIRKLTKNVKELKSKKANNESQKEQNERKILRFTREIDFVKQIERDQLAKFALMNKMSFEEGTCKINIQHRT